MIDPKELATDLSMTLKSVVTSNQPDDRRYRLLRWPCIGVFADPDLADQDPYRVVSEAIHMTHFFVEYPALDDMKLTRKERKKETMVREFSHRLLNRLSEELLEITVSQDKEEFENQMFRTLLTS